MSVNECKIIASELYVKKFLVFAGAGASQDAKVPSWKSLVEALLEKYPIKKCDLNKIPQEQYCDVAQKIYNKLKKQGIEHEYFDIINSLIQPQNSNWAPIQLLIYDTTRWVVTTNFENTFEAAIKYKYQDTTIPEIFNPSLPDLEHIDLMDTHSVVYLHGKADAHFIVFKRDDYDKFYPSVSRKRKSDRIIEDYLKYIYSQFTIVFIGFSFFDDYVRKVFCNIYTEMERLDHETEPQKIGYERKIKRIQHYAFMPRNVHPLSLQDANKIIAEKQYGDRYKIAMEVLKYNDILEELNKIKIKTIPYEIPNDCFNCLEDIHRLRKTEEKSLKVKSTNDAKNGN